MFHDCSANFRLFSCHKYPGGAVKNLRFFAVGGSAPIPLILRAAGAPLDYIMMNSNT